MEIEFVYSTLELLPIQESVTRWFELISQFWKIKKTRAFFRIHFNLPKWQIIVALQTIFPGLIKIFHACDIE